MDELRGFACKIQEWRFYGFGTLRQIRNAVDRFGQRVCCEGRKPPMLPFTCNFFALPEAEKSQ
jgi:hypothetical protein